MVAMMFIIFLVLLLIGVPIAFSLGLSSLFYLFTNNIPLTVISQKFYSGMDSFTLLCIPGFMLAGALMNGGGITRRILNFCNSFLGHFRGSLALVNIVASMVFAGISGTAIADVCSLGSMLIPAMTRPARPLSIIAAAVVMAAREEAHCWSMVREGMEDGSPASRAARRVILPPQPTLFPPIIISALCSGYFPASSLSTAAPSCSAGTCR